MKMPRPREPAVKPRSSALRPIITIGALALAAVAFPNEARAQTKEELAKAKQAFMEGVALASGNDCGAAIVKFKEVAVVKMTPQVAFNIAECEERLGKLVSALGNYRLVQSQLEDPAVKAKAKDVVKQMTGRIEALEGRIPKLTINRGKGAEGATLLLDGTELSSSRVGSPFDADPGPHELIAKVGDKEASRQTITLAEKDEKTVDVEIDLEALHKVDKPLEIEKPIEPPKPPPPPEKGSIVPGAVVTGIGVAAIGAGLGLFLGPRQSAINDLDVACGGDNHCPKSAESIAEKGRLYTGIAEVAAGVGVAAIGAGVVLMVLAGKKKAPAEPSADAAFVLPNTPVRIQWDLASPNADLGGLRIKGSF